MAKLYSKSELVEVIKKLACKGWYKSVKKTIDTRNDGAVGNTIEVLLGIKENNLPIPNTREWELKGQQSHSASLVTLKHIEHSPQASKIVPQLLLPNYGWKHKEAGKKYPENEMSFRSTTYATGYTNRGFTIIVDRRQKKLRFIFDSNRVDTNDSAISEWLKTVKDRTGLGPLNPEPYWGLDDLKYLIGSKIKNCFYIIAQVKIDNKQEFFKFTELYILSGFDFELFLKCLEEGAAFVDFDARTGHNHGTKFRIKQNVWKKLYRSAEFIKLTE